MRTLQIPAILMALACVASVGRLHAQQTTPQGINQRDSTANTTRAEATRDATRGVQQQGNLSVKQVLVKKLQKGNHAEIELAKLAMQRSQNQEIQQFAQMMIEDHQAFNQKLESMGDERNGADRQAGERQAGERQAGEKASGTNRRSNRAESVTNPSDAAADRTADNNRQASSRQTDARPDSPQGNRGMEREGRVPAQLVQIMDQACDNSLKMTKDMLQNYEGQDFSMAYLGQQCVAHTMMLAELQAIQSHGPEELQPVAQGAIEKVKMHLEKAKQLAKSLEDKEGTTRAASRQTRQP